jgi:hypothetical protein
VEDLPNQTTQPLGDGADRLGVAESGNEPAIHDGEDRPLGFHRSLGGLIEDPPHLALCLGLGSWIYEFGSDGTFSASR